VANGAGLFDSEELGYGPTINLAGIEQGGDNGIPLTAVVNRPTAKSNCATVPGLAKLVSAGCVGKVTWQTPRNLAPGTYTYFCRIHPFMRGSFRVVPRKTVKG
jgi:hypothetical protein